MLFCVHWRKREDYRSQQFGLYRCSIPLMKWARLSAGSCMRRTLLYGFAVGIAVGRRQSARMRTGPRIPQQTRVSIFICGLSKMLGFVTRKSAFMPASVAGINTRPYSRFLNTSKKNDPGATGVSAGGLVPGVRWALGDAGPGSRLDPALGEEKGGRAGPREATYETTRSTQNAGRQRAFLRF